MKFINQCTRVIMLVLILMVFYSGSLIASEMLISEEEILQLVTEVTNMTGRSFTAIPEIEVMSDADLRDLYYLEQDILDEIYLENGITQLYRDWFPNICLGKYSWYTGKIYLIEETINNYCTQLDIDQLAMEKVVLIHELIHALDDQSYSLKNLLSKALSTENTTTFIALIEGHAMYYSQKIYQQLNLDTKAINSLMNTESSQYSYYGLTYTTGLHFVQYIFENSILTSKELFSYPPMRTKQILEPEEYLQYDTYQPIILADHFDGTFIEDLPLYFESFNFRAIDNMLMVMVLNNMQADESLLKGFESGFTYQFSKLVESKPKFYHPFLLSYMTDMDDGLLVITLNAFDTADNAHQFWNFCKNYKQSQNEDLDNETLVEPTFSHLVSAYDSAYLNLKHYDSIGNVFYFLLEVQSRYVVEIVASNLPITEENILQIMETIEKRFPETF